MLSLAIIFNLTAFYFIYGEKANYAQLTGCALMLCAIACMSIKLDSQEEEDVDTSYIYWALLTAFIAPVLMSSKHVCVRYFVKKSNYGAAAQAIDGFIIEYTLLSLIAVADPGDFEFNDYLVATSAGFLMSAGRLFINIAVAIGIAGVAQSLMSMHAVWQTLWGILFASQAITWLQGVGFGFAISGLFCIGFLKLIVDRCSKKAEPAAQKIELPAADPEVKIDDQK